MDIEKEIEESRYIDSDEDGDGDSVLESFGTYKDRVLHLQTDGLRADLIISKCLNIRRRQVWNKDKLND